MRIYICAASNVFYEGIENWLTQPKSDFLLSLLYSSLLLEECYRMELYLKRGHHNIIISAFPQNESLEVAWSGFSLPFNKGRGERDFRLSERRFSEQKIKRKVKDLWEWKHLRVFRKHSDIEHFEQLLKALILLTVQMFKCPMFNSSFEPL